MIRAFSHQRAATVEEALDAMEAGAVPYAGGTELLAAMKLGFLAPERLVDIKRIASLRVVTVTPTELHIGATTPHAGVAADTAVCERMPMLARLANEIGNPRVRWQGTIGGNIAFAEPRSDLIPALIAMRARVRLRTVSEERSVAVEEFIRGPLEADLRPGELVVAVEIPTADLAFQIYERIRLLERPTASVALVGRQSGWRLCVGAAGYVPVWRDAGSLCELDADEVAAAVEPIEDTSGSAEYKRHLVSVLTSRVLALARSTAQ